MDDKILILAPAIFGLLGTLAGGSISFLTSHSLKSKEWKHDLREMDIAKREKLYAAYLDEFASLITKSIDSDIKETAEFAQAATLLAQIRIISSPAVVDAATTLISTVFDKVEKKNQAEPQEPAIKRFSSACRDELEQLRCT